MSTIKRRKMGVPNMIKQKIWNMYVGREQGVSLCTCCDNVEMTKDVFYIIDLKQDNKLEDLRPVCHQCRFIMKSTKAQPFLKEIYDIRTPQDQMNEFLKEPKTMEEILFWMFDKDKVLDVSKQHLVKCACGMTPNELMQEARTNVQTHDMINYYKEIINKHLIHYFEK